MSTVSVTVNVAGAADAEDRQAMIAAITRENEMRAAAGLSALPFSTAAERKASVEAIYADRVRSIHSQWIAEAVASLEQVATFRQLKTLYLDANEAKRQAAIAALQ